MAEDLACKEFVELVTDYLEDELPLELRARFDEHLEICPDCREYLRQIRISMDALRHAWESALHAEEREKLLQLFREWKTRSSPGA